MWLRWFAFPVLALAGLGVLSLALLGFVILLAYPNLPSIEALTEYQPKIPLRVYTADGLLIGEFGEERRSVVSIEEVPSLMKQAILAAEDERFYQHTGVDYHGVLRAAYSNLVTGGKTQGASTITMQVARNFFLSREKTLTRKLYEALLAFKIENSLGKDQILEIYINQIYLGQRAYGFGAAAQVYFGKTLSQLNSAEIAMLAGLPKAPSSFNPVINPKRAKQRQLYVLRRMRELALLDDEQYEEAQRIPISVKRETVTEYEIHGEFVAEMVRQLLYERYPEEIYSRGFRVYTTITRADQEAAYAALRQGLLEYDRRHGYRGPEGFVDIKDAKEEDYEEILQDHPDSDDLLAALDLEESDRLPARRRDRNHLRRGSPIRRAHARCEDSARPQDPPGRGGSHPKRRKRQLANRPDTGCRGRIHLGEPAGRRSPIAGRRVRLQPESIQSRHAGLEAAGLGHQALYLLLGSREGFYPSHRHQRRARGRGRGAHRGPGLGAQELRRKVRRADELAHGARQVEEHGVDPRPPGDRPPVRSGLHHPLRLRRGPPSALPHHGAWLGRCHAASDGARFHGVRHGWIPDGTLRDSEDRRRSRQCDRAVPAHPRRRRVAAGHRRSQRFHHGQHDARRHALWNRGARHGPRPPGSCRQERHDQRLYRCLVQRLSADLGHRRLGRLRSAEKTRPRRDRLGHGAPDLDELHGQSAEGRSGDVSAEPRGSRHRQGQRERPAIARWKTRAVLSRERTGRAGSR